MFISLRIIITALVLMASGNHPNAMTPSYHGGWAGAFALPALLEGVVWVFGKSTGKFFKSVGLDANTLDSKAPPVGTAMFFTGLAWLTPTVFLLLLNRIAPDMLSLAGWHSAAIGGIIWLIISATLAVPCSALEPNIQTARRTRNVTNPNHLSAGMYEAGEFIVHLYATPYVWRKDIAGRIVGILDRGFGRYYQVEWHTDNSLVTIKGAIGRGEIARGRLGFNADDHRAVLLSKAFEELCRDAAMKDALQELTGIYPGKPLFKLPEVYPSEIIVEVERTTEMSRAVAVISRSDEHHHDKATETYKILRGTLSVFLDGKETVMKQGDVLVIPPGVKHWARGDAAWVEVDCTPPWTPEDHILEKK